MTETLPPNVVQGAGLLWLLATPLLWLGAALSKMDTVDRYNVQLAIVSGVCVLAVGAGLSSFSFKAYRWARLVLILLSWAAAVFWLVSGYLLWRAGDMLPIIIGCCSVTIAVVLHFTERQPSRESWDAA